MLKILIVDDDSIIRQGLRKIMEKKAPECEVVGEAADGETALDILMNRQVDLLVTDIKMPIMDGIELIKRIHELKIRIKIIVLSGFDEYKYVRESLKFGAVDYLLKPVQKDVLLQLIDKVKEDLAEEMRNEQQNQLLHNRIADSMSILKERLLTGLVKGVCNPNCEKEIAEYVNCNAAIYRIALLCVDTQITSGDPANNYIGETQAYLLRDRIENGFEKKEYVHGVLTAVLQAKVVVMFLGEMMNDLCFEKEASGVLDVLEESFLEKEGATFTAGISNNFYSTNGTCIAYNQAALALQRRFYEGKGILIPYVSENCCYKSINVRQFFKDIEELKGFIEIGESGKVKKSVHCFLEKLGNENIEPEQFREVCSHVLSAIFGLLPELGDISKEYYKNGNSDVFFCIKELNTYEELKEYVSDYFYDITQRLNSIRAERSKKIIELAKEYIQIHFREDVNLNSVAERVYLNQFYFSNLFKSETGKNFTDFLIETRINEAKKLLGKPELKVYEIGQMVGYDEPVSFNRAFKRVVGISPAEYRKVVK